MSEALTLENRLKKIQFRMKHVPDITFLFGPDGTDQCKANTTFLAMQSEVFDSMFFDKLPPPEQIHLPDMEKHTFVDLMDFMYVDYVKLTPNNVFPLLRASMKYKINDLTKQCSNYVIDQLINDENCWRIRQENANVSIELAEKCLDQIVANPNVHFGKSSFFDIPADELINIVSHPKLKRCTHQELRMITTKWLKHNFKTAPSRDTEAVLTCLERIQKCPALCEHENCNDEKAIAALVATSGTVNAIHWKGKSKDGRKLKTVEVNAEALAIIQLVISVQAHLKSAGIAIVGCLIAVVVGFCLFLFYFNNYAIETELKSCTPNFFGYKYCFEK